MTAPAFDMTAFFQSFAETMLKAKDSRVDSSDISYFYLDAPID